jgi:tetratricopeptide (TPR) repeat protein
VLLWSARRRPGLHPFLADAFWFLLPLAPVANIVSLGYSTLIAERFLYLPFLGVASLVTRGLWTWLRRAKSPVPAVLAVAAVSGAYAAICIRYLPVLRTNATLWAYEVQLAPENPLLRLYQSQAEWQAGRLEAAMAAARASYERARVEDARAEAALSWASIRFQIAAGREAALLVGLRDFFDTLATGPGAARLEADGLRFEAQPTDSYRTDLQRRTSLRLSRAVAHARTGDPVFAERLLRDLMRDAPSPAAAGNLVRVLGHQQRWDEAAQVLVAAQARYPNDPVLAELRAPIDVGRSLARSGQAAGERASLQRARVWIALQAPALARRELAGLGAEHAWDPEVVLCTAMADAADGDLDAARRRIEAARVRYPEQGSTWDAALAQVQALASGTPRDTPPKPSSLDALFR